MVAAMVLGDVPVKWIEDRAENLISGGHARQESLEIIAATDENGVLLAGRANHIENVGAYPSGGNGQKAGLASKVFPGPYHWSGPGSVAYSGQAVYTNTCGLCAYRGPWMMETTGREQMVDVIAHKLGIDPLEFRRRNVISRDELPYTNPMSMVYEGVSPQECLEQAAELIGYEQFRKDQEQARAEGRLVGIGLSLYIEPQPAGGTGGSAGADDPDRAQRQGQRVHGHRQPRAGHRHHHDPDRGRRDGRQGRGRELRPGRHGLHALRLHHRRQPDRRGGRRGRARRWGGHEGAGPRRGRADAGDRPGRPGDDRQRRPREGRPGEQGRDAGRDRRGRLPAQPHRAAAGRRAGPGDLQAVPRAGLDVFQRLPRGDGRDRPGDRAWWRSCAT